VSYLGPCEGDTGGCPYLSTGACPICSKSLCDQCQADHEAACIEDNVAGEDGWDEDFDHEPLKETP
jgi:hypothetical protein